MTQPILSIAVAYLVSTTGIDWYSSCQRFLQSYKRYPAGAKHSLYVLVTGIGDGNTLSEAKNLFNSVPHTLTFFPGDHLDINTAIDWANKIDQDQICILNSESRILAENWLQKLASNLALPNVGLVGATGSFESLKEEEKPFPEFPNPYVRLNAFMIDCQSFCSITKRVTLGQIKDVLQFERGQQSLTRQVLAGGQEVLVVGRNGRGYSPKWWPTSDTFQTGRQENLLIADHQTRQFLTLRWLEKRQLVFDSWGQYIREEEMMLKLPAVFRREFIS